jgi:predicted transposase/invertase (TIGR01784 family)
MAKRPPNIHDTFVRESFSDPERAAAAFERFLPQNLTQYFDFSTLVVLKESYINETLQEHFSDLVFEVSLKTDTSVKTDIVLLFEHKSSPDRNVLFQVGHYMFAHWVKYLSENKQPKPIIPVIYYQGKKNWNVGNLADLFKNYPKEVSDYLPLFKYIFIDLKTIDKEQLLGMRSSMMAAAMLAQQWRMDPVKLKDEFYRIYKIFQEGDSNTNFLEMIVVYSFRVSDIQEVQLAEVIKSIPEPIKENIMSTYIMLIEKGKKEGKLEGEQIGKIKEKTEFVFTLFDEGFDTASIARFVKLPEEEVVKILKDHGKIK